VNVIVDLDATEESRQRVGDGYRVDAQIEIARWPDALQVPTAALFREGESWAVYVVREGRAHVTSVKIGAMGSTMAVVENGLREGDQVVVYPGDDLEDGRRVAQAG
jgi:HlyD family secretion protein